MARPYFKPKLRPEEVGKPFVWRTWGGQKVRIDVSAPAVALFGQWIQQSGKHIWLFEMETSHIKRCIAMIERKAGWRNEYLEPLKQELYARTVLQSKVQRKFNDDQH